MTTKRSALKAVLGDIERPPDRSALFYWLVDHHDELVTASRARPMPWASLCARFHSLELTNRDGKPVTEETARKTWRRARDFVVQQQAAETARREAEAYERATGSSAAVRHPSRVAVGWQPTPASPEPTQVVVPEPLPAAPQTEPGLLARIGRSILDLSSPAVEQPAKAAEASPTADPAPPALPKEGGPLSSEQVRAMKARLQRTLDERSGR